jgi:hypothetical protein
MHAQPCAGGQRGIAADHAAEIAVAFEQVILIDHGIHQPNPYRVIDMVIYIANTLDGKKKAAPS